MKLFAVFALYVLIVLVPLPAQAFILRIHTDKSEYLLGEPVVIYVSLRNDSSEPVELTRHLEAEAFEVKYQINGKSFIPWLITDPAMLTKMYMSGETAKEEIKLIVSAKGWVFKEPGTYTVTAELDKQLSNSLTLTIVAPTTPSMATPNSPTESFNCDSIPQQLLENSDAGLFLLFEGGRHLTTGIQLMEQIVTHCPNSPYATYAQVALGNNQLYLGNYEPARVLLEAAKQHLIGFYDTVHAYAFLSQTYQKLGNPSQAQALLAELKQIVAERYSHLAEFVDPVLERLGAVKVYRISGYVRDSTRKPLADVFLQFNGRTAVTSPNGYYEFSSIPAGTYTLTANKTGYVFQPVQATVDEQHYWPEIFLISQAGPVQTQAMLIVSTHSCETQRNDILLTNRYGSQLLHEFDTGITNKTGIYVTTGDVNGDQVEELVINEIAQGNTIQLFDATGHSLNPLSVSSDNRGVQTALGDLDGDGTDEILVASQEPDTSLRVYHSDGNLLKTLKLFDSATSFTITTGDTDNNGTDEIIVVLAQPSHDHNVFIYTGEGNLLNRFTALANNNQSPALVVTTGDVNADGKAEIIVSQADKPIIAIHKADQTLIKTFDLSNTTRKADKITVCHKPDGSNPQTITVASNALEAHLAHGDTLGNCAGDDNTCPLSKTLSLASGDVDSDNRADIFITQPGTLEILVVSAEGNLLNHIILPKENVTITDLEFSEQIKIDLPTVQPHAGELLKDVTVMGTPASPLSLKDNTFSGTVRLFYTTISNLQLNHDANLRFGAGVQFATYADIPEKSELTAIFPIIHVDITGLSHVIPPPDLSFPLVPEQPSLLDDLRALVATINLVLTQNPLTGHLEAQQDFFHYAVLPTAVKQVAPSTPVGILFDPETNRLTFTTVHGQQVAAYPVIQDLVAFIEAIQRFGLSRLILEPEGKFTVTNFSKQLHYSGWTDLVTTLADGAFPLGIMETASPDTVFFVFEGVEQKKRLQVIYL